MIKKGHQQQLEDQTIFNYLSSVSQDTVQELKKTVIKNTPYQKEHDQIITLDHLDSSEKYDIFLCSNKSEFKEVPFEQYLRVNQLMIDAVSSYNFKHGSRYFVPLNRLNSPQKQAQKDSQKYRALLSYTLTNFVSLRDTFEANNQQSTVKNVDSILAQIEKESPIMKKFIYSDELMKQVMGQKLPQLAEHILKYNIFESKPEKKSKGNEVKIEVISSQQQGIKIQEEEYE